MIDNKLVSSQSEIINDHIAFRTLGVKKLGLKSFEKIFLHYGYKEIFIGLIKLNAYWYSPQNIIYLEFLLANMCK